MLAVHCMPDHTHLFAGLKPSCLISNFVKEIKVQNNEFINEKKWVHGHCQWQAGYGVFSYGHSQIDKVCRYVLVQEDHHKEKHPRRNIMIYLKNFLCLLKKGIFSNGLNDI